jgi:cardiolipin synthase A/B
MIASLITIDALHIGSLILLAHVLGVLAAFHAVANARTSQGAVAWVVALVAMPYLTLLPYLFLGSSHFSGYVDARRLGNQRVRTAARDAHLASRAGDGGHAARLLGGNTVRALTFLADMPFVPGNKLRLLVNGTATFDAIFDAIDHAEHYIAIQFFIVRDDHLGRTLRDKLLARAAAGVKVYFLYDGIGSTDLPRDYVETLRDGHVEIHAFATRKFINRFQLNFRNHRKIVVVDGRRAFLGGHNVGVEYLGEKTRLSPWRDTHVELRGPVVAHVQFVFLEDWYWVTQRLPEFKAASLIAGSPELDELVAELAAPAESPAQAELETETENGLESGRERETGAPTGIRAGAGTETDTDTDPVDVAVKLVPLPPPLLEHVPGDGEDEPHETLPGHTMRCQVLATGPADRQETASLFFVEAINAARRRVWITTPYFVPDEAVFAALRLAVMRGVDVRILIPSRRDHFVVFAASTLYAHDAIHSGIRIYRYEPGFLHQKVMLIDEHTASIGTANLDNRSFRLNFEIILLTVDHEFAKRVAAMLTEDFAHSREIDRAEYSGAPLWHRMLMTMARLFSPVL